MSKRTVADLAREALDIQYAVNPLGLTKSFAAAVQELHDLFGLDTQSLWEHPVTRLLASALHEKAGMGLSNPDRYHEAYWACEVLAAQGK